MRSQKRCGPRPTEVETICRTHGIEHDAALGVAADGAALLSGLRKRDFAQIACHGHLDERAGTFDLLLAQDGALPSAAIDLVGRLGSKHRLAWEKVAQVDRASPIVLSTACDSGGAVLHEAGERLGLERALFAAGTVSYVAPQWRVFAEEAQALSVLIVQSCMVGDDQPVGQRLWQALKTARDGGIAPRAARAMALFGDWL